MQTTHWGRFAPMLLLVLTTSLWGCVTPQSKPAGLFDQDRIRIAGMDDFGMLLVRAAVDIDDIPVDATLSTAQMGDLLLLLRLKIADGNLCAYGPRVLASFLLQEALRRGEPASRALLTEELRRHTHLAVLNPEGHLVYAYSGTNISWVGPLRISNGVPQAGAFKVDAFYVKEGTTYKEAPHFVAPAFFQKPVLPTPVPSKHSAPLTTASAP